MPGTTTGSDLPYLQPERYEIRIQGHLNFRWSEWLGCQEMTHTRSGETILYCLIPDQPALHGLLAKIRDMNLKLLSVSRVEPLQAVDKDQNTDE